MTSYRPKVGVPKRVALFTGNYNHIADGVSLTLNRLVHFLEQNGVEVLVFAPTVSNPPVEHYGRLIPVRSIPLFGRSEYRMALGLPRSARDALEDFRPTLYHIATPDFLGRAALRHARRRGVPVVASYHTHFSSYLKYYRLQYLEGILWAYLRWFYRRCRHVYVPSRSMAAVLQLHDIRQNLKLWERGVETGRFTPGARSMTWRRAIGVKDTEPLITFVSRLVWEKGLDIYASVILELERLRIPHKSMIVGDGPAREELQERLRNTIFTGHLGGDALPRAYASSDVFLFPSETETFGNVTLEAMASGVPCVCADATGSNALVQHNVTGLLASPGNSQEFFSHVLKLVSDNELRSNMSRRARRHAMRYDWGAVLGRMITYYDEILNPDESNVQLSASEPIRHSA